jgi:hypothetical protein
MFSICSAYGRFPLLLWLAEALANAIWTLLCDAWDDSGVDKQCNSYMLWFSSKGCSLELDKMIGRCQIITASHIARSLLFADVARPWPCGGMSPCVYVCDHPGLGIAAPKLLHGP